MKKRNLISLFAGAGGLDLGLEMAGFTTKVANELEPHACETLRFNKALNSYDEAELDSFINMSLEQKCNRNISHTERQTLIKNIKAREKNSYLKEAEVIDGDIRSVESSVFKSILGNEDLFCIAGGPPCQPFSKAGKQKSFDCTKNGDLFFEFVRLVKDLKPKWFIFENVKGLTFTKTEVLYNSCKECNQLSIAPFKLRQIFKSDVIELIRCEVCGSKNTQWITKSEAGGSLKIILNEFQKIGYTCQYNILNSADYGAPQIRERLFIIGSIHGAKINWPKPTHSKVNNKIKHQHELFEENLVSDIKPWLSVYDALWKNGHPEYNLLDKNTAVLWVKNLVRPHDEPVTWDLNRPSPTIGAHQGAKLAIAPIGVPDKQIFRQQWHTKGRRQSDTPPVFVEHRYLSDQDLLRLQTFPSWWYLHGTRMQRAFQIGNAVPPILAKVVGDAVINADLGNYE